MIHRNALWYKLLSQFDLPSNTESLDLLDWPSLWPFLDLFWVRLKHLENQGWRVSTNANSPRKYIKIPNTREKGHHLEAFPSPDMHFTLAYQKRHWGRHHPPQSIPIQHFNSKPPKPSRPSHLSSPPHNMQAVRLPKGWKNRTACSFFPPASLPAECWPQFVVAPKKRPENLTEPAKNRVLESRCQACAAAAALAKSEAKGPWNDRKTWRKWMKSKLRKLTSWETVENCQISLISRSHQRAKQPHQVGQCRFCLGLWCNQVGPVSWSESRDVWQIDVVI